MIVTRKTVGRRTVLRGLGAAVSLPLLDAMVPALTALAQTPAKSRARFGVVYVPMGAVMNNWTPAETGAGFPLSPILEPIGKFRDRMVVLTNLDNEPAVARLGEPAGGHGRIGGAFLTGVHAKPTEGADFEAGVSIDQIAARHIGQQTQLASLELGLETTGIAGACDVGYSCAYVNTLCWRTATHAAPDGEQPAGGVRAPVRRQRQHRARVRARRGWRSAAASSIRSPRASPICSARSDAATGRG